MKKLAIVLSCLALTVACSGEETKDNEGGNNGIPDQCSADCNGALVGVPNMLCTEYNSSLYESGNVICTEECTVDLSGCVEAAAPTAVEFQQCTGTGQGNCSDGLDCVTFDGQTSYCVTPCRWR